MQKRASVVALTVLLSFAGFAEEAQFDMLLGVAGGVGFNMASESGHSFWVSDFSAGVSYDIYFLNRLL
jgi:hypothetical protein